MRLIDADEFKEYIENGILIAFLQAPLEAKKVEKLADGIIKDIDEQPTVEAIPKDQYEARLKTDMVAMLTDIQLEIDEKATELCDVGWWLTYNDIIQQKIDKLKGEQNV